MVFEALHVVRRLQEKLEQIQKYGGILGLDGQRIKERALPLKGILGRGSCPFLIKVQALPAIVDGGPLLPSRFRSEHDHHHPPTIAVGFIAVHLDKAILSIRQIVSPGHGHRLGLPGSKRGESLAKRSHGHGGIVSRLRSRRARRGEKKVPADMKKDLT
jgi:hypothetical protein